MQPLVFAFVALASVLFGSATWSCDDENTPTESVETGSAQEQQARPGMPSAGDRMIDQSRPGCLLALPGADVTVTDTAGGVALTFTTATSDVADLRVRVQRTAQMYEKHPGQASTMWHHMGGEGIGHGGPGLPAEGMGHRARIGPMPAATTTMTDTDLGARLELRPTDPSQLDALRELVRWHQQTTHSGDCWMPQEQPTKTSRCEEE